MADIHRIELDCPPGSTRPDTCLSIVLSGLELTEDDFVITSKFFGEWTFELKQEKNETYLKLKKEISERIKKLHDQGFIRYGSW
ncbi:hypothetical protein QKU48_gp0762 [Fadolivirus algeromassiliense]|jgi:hypothetical protein|uniref:Uncharacterized protein n=1 Tax=Fadolivirus FV1/VV64 TaxID=3070911 RepID=A0A7D3QX75_9VIRU|nr:hypothetical protein QKU48_gp0762 [Fadolivirus algeromassiliense]QKF94220.1 hypothetical protein Fadolivirus_1_762 [Fadolivirus FV1/VV64]